MCHNDGLSGQCARTRSQLENRGLCSYSHLFNAFDFIRISLFGAVPILNLNKGRVIMGNRLTFWDNTEL